jgi:hypothetical protein
MSEQIVTVTLDGRRYDCTPTWGFYSNGRWALRLFSVETGEAIVTATANLPDHPMADDEIAINRDSDTEQGLVDAAFVQPSHRTIQELRPGGGKIEWKVCKLIHPVVKT